MRRRVKNWATTIIGMVLAIIGLVKLAFFGAAFVDIIFYLVLAWVFIMAKNSLLEGLFLNLFKIDNLTKVFSLLKGGK